MLIRHKVLVILAVIGTLLLSSTATLAKKDPFYVYPQYGLEYTVSSSDEIVIQLTWVACSKGLVNDYIESVDQVIYFDDVSIDKAFSKETGYWSTPVESDFFVSSCVWDVENTWISYWEYSLGKLKPGEYKLSLQQWLTTPVIDGLDLFSPIGELDVYQGNQDFNATIIHVVP